MLRLRHSPASPFVRKVRICAALLGLADRIELVPADTTDANEPLREQNPLGRIPTLILEDGATLYDSPVIVEYLDMLAGGGGVIPPTGPERIEALRQQAFADGLLDAALIQVYEVRFRPENLRSADWMAYQADKVRRALAYAETHLTSALPARLHVGHIALACALGYLDLRFDGRWRADHPRLVAWLDGFSAQVPAFEETRFTA